MTKRVSHTHDAQSVAGGKEVISHNGKEFVVLEAFQYNDEDKVLVWHVEHGNVTVENRADLGADGGETEGYEEQ